MKTTGQNTNSNFGICNQLKQILKKEIKDSATCTIRISADMLPFFKAKEYTITCLAAAFPLLMLFSHPKGINNKNSLLFFKGHSLVHKFL